MIIREQRSHVQPLISKNFLEIINKRRTFHKFFIFCDDNRDGDDGNENCLGASQGTVLAPLGVFVCKATPLL